MCRLKERHVQLVGTLFTFVCFSSYYFVKERMKLRESPKILIHQLLFSIRYLSVNSLKAFLVSKGPYPHFKFIRLVLSLYSVLKQDRYHGTRWSRTETKVNSVGTQKHSPCFMLSWWVIIIEFPFSLNFSNLLHNSSKNFAFGTSKAPVKKNGFILFLYSLLWKRKGYKPWG